MKDKTIFVSNNKGFRLDNVLILDILEKKTVNTENVQKEDTDIDLELERMSNEIKVRGANQIGPLIQYAGTSGVGEDFGIFLSIMLQADRYIDNASAPYRMEPVIKAKNCMYARFTGMEEDIQYAYQKIAVTAYEEDIKLKGSSYTVFLDSNDDGTITADIFMERADA